MRKTVKKNDTSRMILIEGGISNSDRSLGTAMLPKPESRKVKSRVSSPSKPPVKESESNAEIAGFSHASLILSSIRERESSSTPIISPRSSIGTGVP